MRGSRDELDRLAIVINEMLDRIAALMENLSQVSSDIAHDLRTPLTRLRHRLERAASDARSPADYAAALNGALAETDEMLSLFSGAVCASPRSGAAAAAPASRSLDLAEPVRHVAEIYRPVAEDSDHDFAVETAPAPPIQGDRELLIQLLANLIENAIRHTPVHTAIALGLEAPGGRPVLFVADRGPGIAEDQREKLFHRFTRLEQSRTTPGHGLGLALVAAIADLHGATVTIADNKPGTRVEIRFGAALISITLISIALISAALARGPIPARAAS